MVLPSRFRPMLAGALAALMVFSACATREDAATDQATDAPADAHWEMYREGVYPSPEVDNEPTRGGVVTFAGLSEPRTLDPALLPSTGQVGGNALVAVYDQLVRYNFDTGEYEPRVAESVTPNDDAMEWTVTLRPDVTFSDGTPLNADAVVSSVERYQRLRSGDDGALMKANLASVNKVDDRTVKFTLTASWPRFNAQLAKGVGMIVHPDSSDDPQQYRPIGVGAFVFDAYRPAEELILKANPNYWDGEAYLDGMRFVWLGAPETTTTAFETGDVDAFFTVDPAQFEKLRNQDIPGFVQISGLGSLLLINGEDGRPGADETVRSAIAHAVDEQDVNQRAYGDAGVASKRLFSQASRWYDDSVAVKEYDPAKAQELVTEAKAAGFDGNVELITTNNPEARDEALALTAQLEAVGFTVEHTAARTTADLVKAVFVDRQFDVARSGISVLDADPYAQMYGKFHSESASRSGPADPEMDALLDELRSTEMADAGPVLSRIEARFQESNQAIALGPRPNYLGWRAEIQGVVPTNDMMSGWEKAWIAR